MTSQTKYHTLIGVLTVFFSAVLFAIVGYLIVYWWVFGSFSDFLDVNVLKNQIISQRQASDVRSQLRDLGYDINDSSFYHLTGQATSNYHADVLGGYEPIPVQDKEGIESYYFYDKNGGAYFFEVGENGKVNPENFIPLIRE